MAPHRSGARRALRTLCTAALLLLGVFTGPSAVSSQTMPINAHVAISGHINTCLTNPSGGTDSYACALDSHITALEPKACYGFVADVANTGTASITFTGLGAARTITKTAGGLATTLRDNDIRAGMIVHVCWDGTTMQCQNCLGNGIIASGTLALATSAIASGVCATTQTATATGTLTTDVVLVSFNQDVTAVTGYTSATTGTLRIDAFPLADQVGVRVCNATAASITPGAVVLNWRVLR